MRKAQLINNFPIALFIYVLEIKPNIMKWLQNFFKSTYKKLYKVPITIKSITIKSTYKIPLSL